MLGRRTVATVVLASFVWLQGCMTFNSALLPKVELPPKIENKADRPVVEIQLENWVHTLNGKATDFSMMDTESGGRMLAKNMVRRWRIKGFVSDFGYAGELKGREPDYRLTVSGELRERGSIAGAILTGLTLLLLPNSSSITLVFDLTLEDLRNGEQYSVAAENGYSMWIWLLFAPLLPFGLVGSVNAQSDLFEYVYDQFAEQGAFSSAAD